MPIPGDLLANTLSSLAFVACAMTGAAPPPGTHPHPHPPARGRGQRQARQDRRRARPLHRSGRRRADQPSARSPGPADGRHQHAHRGDGRAGHRRRGAEHQPATGTAPSATSRPSSSRSRTKRWWNSAPPTPTASSPSPPRPCSIPISPRNRSNTRCKHARLPRRRRRRQRRRRGTRQPQVPSVLGQVRGARRARLHASARHARAGAERPARRQRPADQHDRQPAGDHHRAVAPDLRRHARPLSRAEDLRRARRRLPAVLRQPVGRGVPLLPRPGRSAAEEALRRRICGTASCISIRSCSRPRRCAT